MTKSVVSTLVGMALGDGLLDSTDRKVVDFFPGRTIANLDDAKKAITVRHLLDMTSGLGWTEGWSGAAEAYHRHDAQSRLAAIHPRLSDGVGAGHALLLQQRQQPSAVGHPEQGHGPARARLCARKLFGPLGIDDVLWRADPQGVSGGGAGLYLQPRDMAKIGYLWLRGGVWEGKRILPASWIEGVRAANVEIPESWARDMRYGRQFWVMPPRDAFMAVGYHRQLIVVMPKLDIVAVVTGSSRFPSPNGMAMTPRYSFGVLVDYLAAAVTSDVGHRCQSRGDGRARRAGDRQPPSSSRRRSASAKLRPMAKTVSGRIWRFDGNPMRIKSLTLKLDDPQPSYEYELDRRSGRRPGGPIRRTARLRRPLRCGRAPTPTDRAPRAAPGRPMARASCYQVQTLGNDDVARVTLVFSDKTLELSAEWAGGFKAKAQGRAED